MINLKKIAAATVLAGALSVGALGMGAGVADAQPWHPHPGPGWHGGPGYAPGWYPPPPPPPPPYYGYGGYNPGPCVTGPLGFLQVCA